MAFRAARVLPLVVVAVCSGARAGEVFRLGDAVVPTRQEVRLAVDPAKASYTGSVTVELDVKRPAKSFRFHAQGPRVTALRLARGETQLAASFAPAEHDTVEVTLAQPLQPGAHTLSLEFEAPFNTQAVGLYKVVHEGAPYLFTQLQAIDARRAFPCWDEPSFKIPWQLTVVAPAGLDVVSNTPVEHVEEAEGTRRVRFARTRPLPSYLIALAVGRFDATEVPGTSVPTRILAPRGETGAAMAARLTPPILAALERYFGGRYPYEKLDLIAVPEYWFGAMENPGLIVFRDSLLLIDEAQATPDDLRSLSGVIAHELAHMWFGDLVTMAWWDDFWLNESFASWMGDKVTDTVHPELDVPMAVLASTQLAMVRDARPATRAIRLPGISPNEAMRTVGNVYDKGEAILGMFEAFVGPDRFRAGILDHLAARAWQNADTRAFFEAIGRHAPAGVAAAMDGFVSQPGVPLVSVERAGPRALRLRQSRFVTVGEAPPVRWSIPVALRAGAGDPITVLLDGAEREVTLDRDAPWIFPNAGGAGYYRWQLPEAELIALARAAAAELTPRERVALLGNVAALLTAGRLGGGDFVEVHWLLARDPDPHVMGTLVATLPWLGLVLEHAAARATFSSYVRRVAGPMLARLGWEPRKGEPLVVTERRPLVIAALAFEGRDVAVRRRARDAARRWLADPKTLHPSLVDVVLRVAAHDGDRALFDAYRRRFEEARTPVDRERFLAALAYFARPELRARALAYVLDGPLRPPELFVIPVGPEGARLPARERDRTLAWFTRHHDQLARRIPPIFLALVPPRLAAGCDPARVARARAFLAEHAIEGTRESLDRVADDVAECAALREHELRALVGGMRAARP